MLRIIKKKIFIVVLSGIVNAPNHAKCVLLSNQKWDLPSWILNICEVVILLMTYLIKCVFQIKQKI